MTMDWLNANYRWVIVAAGGFLGCVAIGAHVLAAGFPAADFAGYRLVGHRRFQPP